MPESPFPNDPIACIEWRDVSTLTANGWNPNIVLSRELQLLEFSILHTGWIQPILISRAGIIIDGFHRATLALKSAPLRERYGGKVPCAVLDVSEPDAMLMTVRINRAKGSHVAVKMHDLIRRVIDEHGYAHERVAAAIGAYKGEVELLYQEGVFKAKHIEVHEYSRAWAPRNR